MGMALSDNTLKLAKSPFVLEEIHLQYLISFFGQKA